MPAGRKSVSGHPCHNCAETGIGHPTAALGKNYPTPIVAHAAALTLTLQRYAAVKKSIQVPWNYHLPHIQ